MEIKGGRVIVVVMVVVMVVVTVVVMVMAMVEENEYKKRWRRRRESACQAQACTEVASVGTVGYAHINPDLPSSSTRYNYLRRPVSCLI
ncbi:hypothetical protein M0804_007210 [Polistes exclamans]|nr:hypothetical protein M0804_007210 [Polistes exclamans]